MKRWYQTRKPRLQLEILRCLALIGKQSKGQVESIMKDRAHASIVNSFNELKTKGLIKQSGYKPYSKGRKQYYYIITFDGLRLVIENESNSLGFWKALFGYCHHSKRGLTLENVEELYNLFMKKYLKYATNDIFYQVEMFDNTRNQWLDNVLRDDKPNLVQKILEILAFHPRITIEELAKRTGDNISAVSDCLKTYTLDSYRPLVEDTKYIYQNIIGKAKNKKYQDFLLHCIVTTLCDTQQSKKTYELTLFGLLLTLSLVRIYDMEKLKHGLHYSGITYSEYFDKIALNYKDKLPLVFGKWKLLKNILGIFSDYNFDILLDREILTMSRNLSVARGGNKELFDGLKEVALQTRQQIGDFVNAGLHVWLNYPLEMRFKYEGRKNQYKDYYIDSEADALERPNAQKVYPLMKKINQLNTVLNPLEYAIEPVSSRLEYIREVSHHLEELFADEVTAFYYFNLYYEFEFQSRIQSATKYYSSLKDIRPYLPKLQRPKDCLSLILEQDKNKPLIKEWLHNLTRDIVKLQKETYETLELTI